MSYIEKKYKQKITDVFGELPSLEEDLINLLDKNSIAVIDDIAIICAQFNKKINLILKKYYPEIKEIKDKLDIKSSLKFYYDLIHKLTDLVRNVENFQKIDPEYYEKLVEFITNKQSLIFGKYRNISTQELTTFYDKNSRAKLEKILTEKIEMKSKQYFTIGSLEEEIKKIAKIAGAENVLITLADDPMRNQLKTANSVITFTVSNESIILLRKIGEDIKDYLLSKKYHVIQSGNLIITDAKLFPDEN